MTASMNKGPLATTYSAEPAPHKYEMLELCKLQVDREYQRFQSKLAVKRLIDHYCHLALDPILVGRRSDGSLWIVDGQSRRDMGLAFNWRVIEAKTFKSSGRAHEAHLFKICNMNRRGMKLADLYKACLTAGDQETLEIDALVRKHGLLVSYNKGWPNISGVSKLYDAYRAGVLPLVLNALQAWHGDPEALKELTIGGLRDFWIKFPEADMKRCIRKWSDLPPGRFESTSQVGALSTGSRYRVICMTLMEKYNSGIRNGRLEW
jgi:hypothetical protein